MPDIAYFKLPSYFVAEMIGRQLDVLISAGVAPPSGHSRVGLNARDAMPTSDKLTIHTVVNTGWTRITPPAASGARNQPQLWRRRR